MLDNAPLGEKSWFRVGGKADKLLLPKNELALTNFLSANTKEEITILGAMANTIVRDSGVRGVVIRLGQGDFCKIEQIDGISFKVGTGTLNGTIAAAAAKAGIGGMSFLTGIPGTLGGAIAMNAGAYGSEIKDIVSEIYGVDMSGKPHTLKASDAGFSYRHCDAANGFIFTGALLSGEKLSCDKVWSEMHAIKKQRLESQPIKERTGGSTFANPSTHELENANLPRDFKAWQIVDKVGGRGFQIGGARMSDKHCNFMINVGNATASDLEALGDEMQKRAFEALGIKLHWEIKRIGEKAQ